MPDFDVDKFMAERRKSAGGAQPAAKGFDVDAFMAGKKKPQPHRDAYGRPISVEEAARRKAATDPLLRYDLAAAAEARRATKPNLGENISIGAERGYRRHIEPALSSIAEVTEGMKQGDFRPLGEMALEAGRGVVRSLFPSEPPALRAEREAAEARARSAGVPVASDSLGAVDFNPIAAIGRTQDAPIATAQQRREARYLASPEGQRSVRRLAELDARAALDPSMTGKTTRGTAEFLTGAAPTLAAAVASRGSLPIISLTAAAQSAHQPSMMGPQAAASILPAPSIAPLIRRLKGRSQASTQAPAIRGQVAPDAPATSSLPAPDAPPTQEIPSFSRWCELPSLPARQPAVSSNLPELSTGELPSLRVRPDLAPPKKYPGAQGPRAIEELEMTAAPAQSQPQLQPPPPPTSGPWARQPQQQPLFKGAPASSQLTPFWEQVSAVRKAGLLTNPATHGRNLGGSAIKQVADEISRLPASIVDLAISFANKRRTVSGPSVGASLKSIRQAGTQGAKDAWQILKNGATPQQLQAMGLSEFTSRSQILNAYVRTIFRGMAAGDAFMRAGAARRSLIDRALMQAKTEARAGQIPSNQIRLRAKQLVANPPAEMAALSITDAEVATFNNPNRFADMITGAKDKSGQAGRFVLDTVFPFPRTPANALAAVFEYSGGGALKAAKIAGEALYKRSFTSEQQRALSQSLGRAATGAGGLITAGYILASKGLMTGFREEADSLESRDIAAGRQSASVYNPVSGQWVSIRGFNPVSTLLVIGATIHREQSRSGHDRESGGYDRYAGIASDVIGEHPLAIGAEQVAETLTKPSTLPKNAGKIAGSFVPSVVAGVGAAIDDRAREGRGFVGQVQKRIPILRESLPEQTDALGRPPEHRRFDFLNPAPASTAKDKTDPALREFTRLDIGLTRPQRKQGESEAAHRERQTKYGREFGALTDQIVRSFRYWQLDDEKRRAVFDATRRYLQTRERGEMGEKTAEDIIEAAAASVERRRQKEGLKK